MTQFHTHAALIEALGNPAFYPHPVQSVRLIETHISWVLLAGRYAYKIKKPVNFGFLDFSALEQRRFYCEEEIRINRRLAGTLYREIVAIGGSPKRPVFGETPAFEYAVKMRRFAAGHVLDQVLERGELTVDHIDLLAETVADFHAALPPAAGDSDYGCPETVVAPVRENFHHLSTLLPGGDLPALLELRQACEAEFERCRPLLEQRRHQGMIREGHGDLHLGNIVLLRGRPTPFDAIEFNPALRWIDVISDVAFLLMDLLHRERGDLAYRFVDRYLQTGGDYAGLGVLRFYLGYRAMVRAKVCALRAGQGDTAALDQCRSYMRQTERILAESPRPALIITHGLPGCGKTTLSQILVENLGAVRIRSDVERKRLFGLKAGDSSASSIDGGIYTSQATELTYRRLLDLSRQILRYGLIAIVDAAFLRIDERRQFQGLAVELAVPFAILSIAGDDGELRRRIAQRRNDASEADIDVYQRLKAAAEPLAADEMQYAVACNNTGPIDDSLVARVREQLNRRSLP